VRSFIGESNGCERADGNSATAAGALERRGAHENLDPSFMILALRRPAATVNIGRGGRIGARRFIDSKGPCIMKWETPVAVDFRFGMEITMYVANR
jgi:coenzyme PQQ precursor peptide PqqA